MVGTKQTELKPTSIEELLAYQNGKLVELPPFAEGQPFFAKLKRPSLMALVKKGKIPNSLLVKTNELFNGEKSDIEDENLLKEYFDIMDVIAQATFVEPSYNELQKAGIELTDDQLTFIFNYSQNGVKALESFRTI